MDVEEQTFVQTAVEEDVCIELSKMYNKIMGSCRQTKPFIVRTSVGILKLELQADGGAGMIVLFVYKG